MRTALSIGIAAVVMGSAAPTGAHARGPLRPTLRQTKEAGYALALIVSSEPPDLKCRPSVCQAKQRPAIEQGGVKVSHYVIHVARNGQWLTATSRAFPGARVRLRIY